MRSKKLQGNKPKISTQRYLDIAEIRDDMVVLKDGTVRAVLMVSSVNFDLKSEEEQTAMVGAYVNFLNSLQFPLQIVIQSRQLNIDEYLQRLVETEREHSNELLRMQTADYRNFVTDLVHLEQIMSKKFFIVVPYAPGQDNKLRFWDRLMGIFSTAKAVQLSRDRFEKYARELNKRAIFLYSGITSMGLAARRLNTQALIELYYNSYNPRLALNEQLPDINKLSIDE
ncbi:MAG: hypothetical protein A3B31_01660 [Candidatus Komeilibacteria bacterium RIFCSPLOWO2_01_FULL_53_11]|uniref:TraC-like domain-containing protein n=1 Tax=Candidatus Komeilibacteria bacterium RIFCSPLOWO2_01_FULL_53_11 TaxID=1798552 RepID=A0A1G2BUD0_9BACT|nr:MAG: hypothetical protein A3B31_01660 [Candidatus Komeilibacteria bacterium RIFCSPLOWO2_01_FULL_53_11]